jgi:hypothetical protein
MVVEDCATEFAGGVVGEAAAGYGAPAFRLYGSACRFGRVIGDGDGVPLLLKIAPPESPRAN